MRHNKQIRVAMMICGVFLLDACQTNTKNPHLPNFDRNIREVALEYHKGIWHPEDQRTSPRSGEPEQLEIMKVSWSQDGLLLTESVRPSVVVDAALQAFGKPEPDSKGGFYRANLLFFKRSHPDYLGRVKYDDGIAWIYLPYSDFHEVYDMLNADSSRVYLSCANWGSEQWEAAIFHY